MTIGIGHQALRLAADMSQRGILALEDMNIFDVVVEVSSKEEDTGGCYRGSRGGRWWRWWGKQHEFLSFCLREVVLGRLNIAIVGFGNFGQFLAKDFVRQGHIVFAHSRTYYSNIANSLGVCFFQDPLDLCEQHPDVVVLCTSIIFIEPVLKSLPIQKLKRNILFVDVLSFKKFPQNIFLQVLPTHFDILCTYPMFGPESGKDSWKDLVFVFDKVRIGEGKS
ncbi:Arogenate dehydrogenase 1, chloroplastic [Capsicum chinense]|nr:Arogenate dehydrogenase 1, chloroplastic [Capsicum chinense]